VTAGGALFGMGYVVNGYCPGTAVAGLAYAYACVFASAGYACDALLIFDLLVPACPGQDIFFHTGFPRFTPPCHPAAKQSPPDSYYFPEGEGLLLADYYVYIMSLYRYNIISSDGIVLS